MKEISIFIELKNREQVNWWNNTARKLVKVVRYDTIVETATNKPIGVLINIKGALKSYVIMKNKSFLNRPKTVCFRIKG